MLLMPALGKQKQKDPFEFEATWSTGLVLGQLELLHKETLSQKRRYLNFFFYTGT